MIEAQSLSMRYGPVLALDNASFSVSKGEVAGLLGPNGAGKSTTLKILTTFIVPTSGIGKVAGFSLTDDSIAVRHRIGYMPEVPPVYPDMEAVEYLEFVGRARGLSGSGLRERLGWVTERCGLGPVLRTPARFLSKGYRQRVGLAQALLHDPEVLILDEPTSGLDPHQILEIRTLIRELAREKTVILSTHILQEAEAMSDSIIIINHGRITGQGTREELRRQAGCPARARLSLRAGWDEVKAAFRDLADVDELNLDKEESGTCRFTMLGRDEEAMLEQAGSLSRDRSWLVLELAPVPFTLEEIFLALTTREPGERFRNS